MTYTLDTKILNNQESDSSESKYYIDPRLFIPKIEHTYTVRFLSISNEKSVRNGPFISKYIHATSIKDENTNLYKTKFELCPTTSYADVINPYDACPCCSEASKLWKKFEDTKRNEYRRLYDIAKRRFSVFMPILVISNTEDADLNGKVMLLHYNNNRKYKELCSYLSKNDKSKFFNGFDSLEAKNLIIKVTSSTNGGITYREFEYSDSVAEKKLCNEMTPEWTEKFIKTKIIPLKFDEDFLGPYNEDALNLFYEEYVKPYINKLTNNKSLNSKKSNNDNDFDLDDVTQSNSAASEEQSKNSVESEEVQEEVISEVGKDDKESNAPTKSNTTDIMSEDELDDFISTLT